MNAIAYALEQGSAEGFSSIRRLTIASYTAQDARMMIMLIESTTRWTIALFQVIISFDGYDR